eukprot:1151218-Pelagomonas_calceolata.AAC.3
MSVGFALCLEARACSTAGSCRHQCVPKFCWDGPSGPHAVTCHTCYDLIPLHVTSAVTSYHCVSHLL